MLFRSVKKILQEESSLGEIVRLVGVDSLDFKDRLTLECARSIREDYLHQNAFDDVDTYTSLHKQYLMMRAILHWYHLGQKALKNNVAFNDVMEMDVIEPIGRLKYVEEDKVSKVAAKLIEDMENEYHKLEGGLANG